MSTNDPEPNQPGIPPMPQAPPTAPFPAPPPGGAFGPPPGQVPPSPPLSPPLPPATPATGAWGVPQPAAPMPGALPPPPGGGQPYSGAAPYPGGYQPYGPMSMVNPFDSRASTVLILGILALVLCGPILGPIAWIQGNSLKRDAEAAGYPEPGSGKAGRICGMIGTILSILGILLYVGIFALAIGSSSTSGY